MMLTAGKSFAAAAAPRPAEARELTVSQLSGLCAGLSQQRPTDIYCLLNTISLFTPLLNAIADVVFFIKDPAARYLIANHTLARRCGYKTVAPLLGKTSADVFPAQLGAGYTEQDRHVLQTGSYIQDQLELHLYKGRETGWCMTQKLALRNQQGEIIGMAGISHDLPEARASHPAYQSLSAVDHHIRQHFHRPIAMEELIRLTGLSVAQIERYCKRIFHLTPRQMIHKIRLDHATVLLKGDLPITDIALQCGYTDHSAFSRQFKAMTGTTPSNFRTGLVNESAAGTVPISSHSPPKNLNLRPSNPVTLLSDC